jgi:hypothetical protein
MAVAEAISPLLPGLPAIKGLTLADEAVDLFRFMSRAELDDLMRLGGKFRAGPNSLDAKQFGLSLGEVEALASRLGGADAIVRARVPMSTLRALDRTPLDPSILRSGSATAQPGDQRQLVLPVDDN